MGLPNGRPGDLPAAAVLITSWAMAFDLPAHLQGLKQRLAAQGKKPANGAVGRALICTHDNPDPDSLAAALGLRKLLETQKIDVTIALGGIIGRPENRAMVRELKI